MIGLIVDCMIRHDGLGDRAVDPETGLPTCDECHTPGAGLRCRACLYGHVLCKSCMLAEHARLPLHRVDRWNKSYWVETTLSKLGLHIQLGHLGGACKHPKAQDELTVIDVSGIHTVAYSLCGCYEDETSILPLTQLLGLKWWPATSDTPGTVMTDEACRLFQAQTLQGKVNAYDFWNGLLRITDSSGLRSVKSRYYEMHRVTKVFRYHRILKRAGVSHQIDSVPAIAPGSLAVRCPACPGEDNMTRGWREAPPRERYKHALYVSEDANFKLQRKNKPTVHDVPMADGGLFFVEDGPYAKHLRDNPSLNECRSSHTAVSGANKSGDERYDINGVGALLCARHLFYFPCAIADLRFGERYVSMDYILFVTLRLFFSHILWLYFTYDIACQFSKNIIRRWDNYGTEFRLDAPDRTVRYAVPKFHLPAHGEDCNEDYNLNYTQGAGRTCGEGIEAGWANTNGAALMTREMGPHARHFALNDLFQSINWGKLLSLGTWMAKGLRVANAQYASQLESLQDLESPFPAETIEAWRTALRAWEDDFGDSPNPFHEEDTGHASTNVRLELQAEEDEDLAKGQVQRADKSDSTFLAEGIDIADLRYVAALRALQHIYTPSLFEPPASQSTPGESASSTPSGALPSIFLPELAEANDIPPTTHLTDKVDVKRPETVELAMPWELEQSVRNRVCSPALIAKAIRLHIGECKTALHGIRRGLRAKYAFISVKRVHIDGVGVGTQSSAVTRARGDIQRMTDKVNRLRQKYTRSRDALLVLDPNDVGEWQQEFLAIQDGDLRLPTKDETALGQGFHRISWVWTKTAADVTDIPGNLNAEKSKLTDEDVHESMRVEWCVNRARTDRWYEERELLQVEMERTLISLLNSGREWERKLGSRPLAPSAVRRGLDTRAARQAAIYRGLARSFFDIWKPLVEELKLSVEWPAELLASPAPADADLVDAAAIRAANESGRADIAAQPELRADLDDAEANEDVAEEDGEIFARDDYDEDIEDEDITREGPLVRVRGADDLL
ncbi:hypothetical protein PENSPDRAFT_593941 [Peniophora sp. CONT]|nr:hypothetical protein PENSPDRAFT_593941 [Peniophora sp. CONT]